MLAARTRRFYLLRQRHQARTDTWLAANRAALRTALADYVAMDCLLAEARALLAGPH